jgi:tetratricopeptide (TPR) repeat protein
MTIKANTKYDLHEFSQQFLFSKTDPGRVRYAKRKSIVGMNKLLKPAFPDLMVANRFINDALRRLASIDQFAAMVARVDQVNPSDEKEARIGIKKEIVGIAEILNSACQIASGMWGVIDPGLFGSYFPGKTEAETMKIAGRIQEQLKQKTSQTISIGIAAYPTISYMKSDILDNACKALEHAAFLGPNSAVVFDGVSLNISGDKFYEQGRIKEAREELEKACLLEPSNVNVHNSLGVCYGLLGDYESATDEFKTAIALDPDEYMAYFNLGLVGMLKKQREQALELFLTANEINSNVYEVAFQIGKSYMDLGYPEKSKPFLERAVFLNPESSVVHRYLGDCYAAINMPDEAISAYRKAIKKNPHDAAVMSALGYLFADRGENPEIALMFCRESVALSPENGLFRHRLGRLYSNQKRFDDALVEYKNAIKFGFDATRDIQEIKNRLEKKSP